MTAGTGPEIGPRIDTNGREYGPVLGKQVLFICVNLRPSAVVVFKCSA